MCIMSWQHVLFAQDLLERCLNRAYRERPSFAVLVQELSKMLAEAEACSEAKEVLYVSPGSCE